MPEAFFFIDEPRDGPQNMAIDQAMLEEAVSTKRVLLRFYQWKEPTLSLGYFQEYQSRFSHRESSHLTCVRRTTGGGAIVHDQDWTYSIALPDMLEAKSSAVSGKSSTKGASEQLYDCVHNAVIAWLLETLGVAAERVAEVDADPRNKTFLCFERRSVGDVVAQSCKLLGSAQRRQASALLQHGSLLLAQSSFAPTLPGIQDVAIQREPAICWQDLQEKFCLRIVQELDAFLNVRFTASKNLSSFLTKPVSAGKFTETNWTEKR